MTNIIQICIVFLWPFFFIMKLKDEKYVTSVPKLRVHKGYVEVCISQRPSPYILKMEKSHIAFLGQRYGSQAVLSETAVSNPKLTAYIRVGEPWLAKTLLYLPVMPLKTDNSLAK